jgi:hypothetical protein
MNLAPNGKPSNLTPEQYRLVRTPAFKQWFGDWQNDPANSSKVVDENGEPLVVYHGSNVDFNIFEKSKTNPYAQKQGYFFAFDTKYAESYNSKYVKPFFINIRIKGTFDDDDNLVPFNADGVIVKGLQVEVYDKKNIKLADGSNTTFDGNNPDIRFDDGGNVNDILNEVKEAYERGSNYYEGIINDEEFKIRMNKNHPRNWARNDDSNIHNLSLVNVKIPSAVGTRVVYNKVQKQVDNIIDWDDAESEIKEFFYEISEYEKFYDGGGIDKITCRNCSWSWDEESAGNDKYICHKCNYDNSMYYKSGGVVTYRQKYNKKYGYNQNESHDLNEIAKDTGVSKKGLQQIYNKGIGAYKTNPQSVRPNVKSKEQWAKARVYSAVMGGKAAKIDANELKMKAGGEIQERKETYKKWRSLVNMSKTELEKFYNSQEGKDAGLSSSEASSQGISSGRESARWIMRMKDTPVSEWTEIMWRWANKQISFISRMSGNKGPLYDEKGRKTRKHTSLLIWGHNPKKYELGGGIEDVNTNTIELLNYSVINNFQSGSSLDFYQDLIFVIGDDAKDVVILYRDFIEAKRVNMFQSETARIPKDIKYDLETSTIVEIDGVDNLLILGSGAKQEFRSVGYLIPLNTKYVVPEPFKYNVFTNRLKAQEGIKEINIEGSASVPGKLLLANRGNKSNPDNLLIVTESRFWENQENASIFLCRMLLPDKDAAVSELNYEEETDTLFFTASIEHTTNAIDDGKIGDSFIGYIKNVMPKLENNTIEVDEFINLSNVDELFVGHKIEGICIEDNQNGNYIINLVSDNDNEESTIFKIKMKI